MIELAKYTLEVLRKDAEVVLSRGQREEISSGVLLGLLVGWSLRSTSPSFRLPHLARATPP